MTDIFHRQNNTELPVAVSGEGIYLTDADGKRYLDACGGAAVSCLGHSDPDIVAAIQEQAGKLSYAHTSFFTSDPSEELASLLINDAPDEFGKVYFVSGGSEAVETALKLAKQFFYETGDRERTMFIGRRQSYHGNTIGALSLGENAARREAFSEMLMDCGRVSPCNEYRGRRDEEDEEDYADRLAVELEQEINRLGANRVAAFVAETVGGATPGVTPPVKGYFKRVREICDRYGILLILDEVMCGAGRTGTFFAFEQDDIVPDLICIAKGLGGGYMPIGATLVSKRIFAAFDKGKGNFINGHTYLGHPIACAASLAVQKKIRQNNLLENVRRQGVNLISKLTERFGNHPHVGNIRGRGLFVGVELVADRASKEAFDPALKLHALIKSEAMKCGLMCYPAGGSVDGIRGDHILLAPPFIITESELDELVDKLGQAVDAALVQTTQL